MVANTQRRGKSQSVRRRRRRQAFIRPLLFVFVHSPARTEVPYGRPRESPSRPHPTSLVGGAGPSGIHAALSSHTHRGESIHYVWLSRRSREVTNGEVTGGRECWVAVVGEGSHYRSRSMHTHPASHNKHLALTERQAVAAHAHTHTEVGGRGGLLKASALSWWVSWDITQSL